MRIKSINIPENQCQDGIKGIKMDRLGEVVILAGKNGSGKTRLLRTIHDRVKLTHTKVLDIERIHKSHINKLNQIFNNYGLQIPEDKFIFNNSGINYALADYFVVVKEAFNNINILEGAKTHYIQAKKDLITMYQDIIRGRVQEFEQLGIQYTNINYSDLHLLEIVPKTTQLKDIGSMTHNESIKSFNRKYASLINLETVLFDVKGLQDAFFNSKIEYTDVDEKTKKEIHNSYMKFLNTISKNMGFILGRDAMGNILMNNIILRPSMLSDGQKILLQIIVGLHKFDTDLENTILFMDEPENHLHPSALIDFFNLIRESVPFSQIFIATHSVPLLAYFGVENIWYVEDGTVTYAGKAPQKVLEGLLGDENQINRLRALCDSPAHFAMLDFACECLTPPGVVMTESKDPQNIQISKVLAKIEAENISILDYGCGKARLLANISEAMGHDSFVKRYAYAGFDKFAEDKEVAESVITGVYGNSDNRYFNDEGKLKTEIGEGTVDVVIMCNVLHEIPPQEWGNLFGTTGLISKMLKPNGYLLVVEDMCLTHGEVAHQYGFLVLGTNELMKLFNVTGRRPDDFIVNSQKEDRLLAHLIPKQYVVGYTPEGRKAAICELKTNAQNKLKLIKGQNGTLAKQPKEEQQKLGLKLGHEYAFWVHQYTNADLALAEL